MSMKTGRASTSSRRVCIIGAGAWGTTLAMLAAEVGHSVTLAAHTRDAAEFMDRHRRHPTSLAGIAIPSTIRVVHTGDLERRDRDMMVLAIPAQKLRRAIVELQEIVQDVPLLSAAKGLEVESFLRPSAVIRSILGEAAPVAALSGPNLSGEIAAGHPATTVIASDVDGLSGAFAGIFHSHQFRVYQSDDLIGVELGGALKNIVAIGAGIADGLEAGDNAKAAFMTRGIAEIARLGMACGAQPLTFAGLSGIGDLIATCASPLSRNHQVGAALARGEPLERIVASMNEVAEGVATTRAARALGASLAVDLPIVEQMYRVLFEGVSAQEAIERLMEREPTHERLESGR